MRRFPVSFHNAVHAHFQKVFTDFGMACVPTSKQFKSKNLLLLTKDKVPFDKVPFDKKSGSYLASYPGECNAVYVWVRREERWGPEQENI